MESVNYKCRATLINLASNLISLMDEVEINSADAYFCIEARRHAEEAASTRTWRYDIGQRL